VTPSFDPGCAAEPFLSLAGAAPGAAVYPGDSFRIEWGPVFHRGRLDGSARVLVIGQDPAQHETIVRRILVGEAGHRVQGLLAKLGIERSYVMVNTFVYSVLGHGGEHHQRDAGIVAYRNRWLDAIFATAPIEAVIALGGMANAAWSAWRATHGAAAFSPGFAHITHPTAPESGSRDDPSKHAPLIAQMLANWNQGLDAIAPHVTHPDHARPLVHYGQAFAPGDQVPIPLFDLPAGTPGWMAADDGWAQRTGTGAAGRATITVKVPTEALP